MLWCAHSHPERAGPAGAIAEHAPASLLTFSSGYWRRRRLACLQEKVRSLLKSEMHPLLRAASLMHRYSGSDILEVCKLAARGCVLAEIAQPSAPTSPVSASSRTPPGSPRRGLDAAEGALGDERRGQNGAAAQLSVAAAGPVTEEALLRCISEV